jgi:5'-nucleotidase
MRVLVTNDDGIGAQGLHALRRALTEIEGVETHVIVPDSNRSATARSITTRSPLSVEEVELDDGFIAYATDGTPVDCVRDLTAGKRSGDGLPARPDVRLRRGGADRRRTRPTVDR